MLTNTSCEGLAEAAVVVVAIAVAPDAAVDESDGGDRVEVPVEPAPAPLRPPSNAADGNAERRVRFSLTVLAGVGFGPVPVGFALAPSIAVSSRSWRVGIAAVYEPARSLRLDDLPASGSDLMLALGWARVNTSALLR